jgi:anti-anti-sigma regulatory factor
VLSLEGVNFVDSQGSAKLRELHDFASSNGLELRLARLKPQVRDVLDADGIVDLIGADHIHGNVYRAVEAQLSRAPSPPAPPTASDPRDASSRTR